MKTKPETETLPSASLFFREGASDKEYHARVEACGDGFIVTCAWGRRGKTLQTSTKTIQPVTLAEAVQVFEKLVREKEAKGYRQEGKAATIKMPCAPAAAEPPKYLPQLLNPLPEEQLDSFIRSAKLGWGAQKKYDGKRIILEKRGDVVTAYNRTGKPCGIAGEIVEYAKTVPGDFVLDGEAIGPDYYAFDLLNWNGVDYTKLAYGTRHKSLLKLIGYPNGWPIHPTPLVIGENSIRKFLAELKASNAEGIVFKDLLAPYTPGRPNSGGPQLKCKFYATCSAVVIKVNQQRSVTLGLYLEGDIGIEIGNVTIPPNHSIPVVGQVVEVRYLYAYEGGSLYQPVYLGPRDDIPRADCSVQKQKLKYKAAEQTTGKEIKDED